MVALALFLTTGCATILSQLVGLEAADRYELQQAGKLPPEEIGYRCSQEATVRGPDGSWIYKPELEQECLRKAGW